MSRLRLSAILLVLLLGFPSVLLGPVPRTHTQLGELIAVAAPAPPTPITPAPPATLEDMIARVKPAVVQVRRRDGGFGSGFIYDPSGYVLTNHHVVDGDTEWTVTLPDRRTFPATLVDYIRRHEYLCPTGIVDTWVDAAVLKISGPNLPTIPMGDPSTLRQGQELFVLGYPLPFDLPSAEVSVTRGIVSALRPGWLQTDALAAGGNSGGPVVDRQGRVVGLLAFGIGDPRGGGNFSGVVRLDTIRPMSTAALTGGPKAQEFRITGLEYVPPVTVGRRRVWRNSYEPGNTQTQASASESSSEVTQVQNFAGSFVYTVRTSAGTEARNRLSVRGLHNLGSTGGSWRYVYPDGPLLTFAFPPCLGLAWQYRYLGENASDGTARQVAATVRIMSINDAVTVPAGNFPQTIRIVTTYQVADVRAGQARQWREVETEWWAAGVGVVRTVTENPDTRQRWVSDLISTGAPSVSPSPPPPPPPPPPAPPSPPEPTPPPPEPTPPPPPEVAKLPAPNDRAIVPGERVGAARVGDSLDGVIKVLAEAPTVSRSQSPGRPTGWIVYEWKNRLLAEVDKETRIIQRAGVWAPNPQEIVQPPFRVRGIGIGSGLFEVTGAFGQPDFRRQSDNAVQYVYNRLGLGFWIGTSSQFAFNGQVYQIFVFKPGTFESPSR